MPDHVDNPIVPSSELVRSPTAGLPRWLVELNTEVLKKLASLWPGAHSRKFETAYCIYPSEGSNECREIINTAKVTDRVFETTWMQEWELSVHLWFFSKMDATEVLFFFRASKVSNMPNGYADAEDFHHHERIHFDISSDIARQVDPVMDHIDGLRSRIDGVLDGARFCEAAKEVVS